MTNRIRDVYIVNHRLDPHETELRVHVETEEVTATTEIRGRLIGPRSVYASTVEIAYPMREVARGDHIEMRVVIPEASWWEPKTPFLYGGPVELWQDGACCGRVDITHGIRWLQLTSKGLRLNGRPFLLRGKVVEPTFGVDQAQRLRDANVNTLLSWPSESGIGPCNVADRTGFLVLLDWVDYLARLLHGATELNKHPSCFACIAPRSDWIDPRILKTIHPMLIGVDSSAAAVPVQADFLVCRPDELVTRNEAGVLKIVLTDYVPEAPPHRPDVIGWIETASAAT